MNAIRVRFLPFATPTPAKGKEPGEVRLVLNVSSPNLSETITFIQPKADEVTSLLRMTKVDLECVVIRAMMTKKPQILASYKQRDFAEERLRQLRDLIPFIARAHHTIHLESDN